MRRTWLQYYDAVWLEKLWKAKVWVKIKYSFDSGYSTYNGNKQNLTCIKAFLHVDNLAKHHYHLSSVKIQCGHVNSSQSLSDAADRVSVFVCSDDNGCCRRDVKSLTAATSRGMICQKYTTARREVSYAS